jgi:pilus assembly protein CpaE
LVDCSLQFGDVGVSLNLRANRTITDLVDHIGELDLDLVESVMTKHDASGVQVLLSPAKPEDADLVSADHVRRVLESMKQLYDYIIVDLGSRLQDLELSVFDLANRIILVTAPDVPSVKDVRYFFELVEALEYPHEKLLLVLNKSDTRTGVTPRLIEGNVKHKIFAEIPYERRSVVQSINQGVPYMIMPNVDKRTPLFQNTIVFAQLVLQEFAEKVEEEREPRERPLGRLLG